MSNDGQRAAYGSPFGPIAVQQFADQKWTQVYTLEGHTGRVNDVVMTSDARSALSAADDGTIKLWDIENGRLIRSFEGHTAPVMGSMARVQYDFLTSSNDKNCVQTRGVSF